MIHDWYRISTLPISKPYPTCTCRVAWKNLFVLVKEIKVCPYKFDYILMLSYPNITRVITKLVTSIVISNRKTRRNSMQISNSHVKILFCPPTFPFFFYSLYSFWNFYFDLKFYFVYFSVSEFERKQIQKTKITY